MYYVIQVAPGMEDRTETFIRNKVPVELYHHCFHPLRHVRKKFHGEWKDLHEKLLPGYVFIVSDSVRDLYMELRKVPLFTKVLGRDGGEFAALRESEAEWLERLIGESMLNERNDDSCNILPIENSDILKDMEESTIMGEIGLSQIQMREEGIAILSGPLKKMEKCITKINLHKRIAEVSVEFMGEKTQIYLGIEIIDEKRN